MKAFPKFKFRKFISPSKSHAISKDGIVASSHPLSSQLGLDLLKDGANAVDVAIAMSIVLCFAEPHMTGIGGDCFALISKSGKTKDIKVLNASGYAGRNYDLKYFADKNITTIDTFSSHAVTIPGAIAGWKELHDKYGFLKWKDIFNIAIDVVKDGVLVNERVSQDWKRNEKKLLENNETKKIFTKNHLAYEHLDNFKNNDLLNTFKFIAEEGEHGFYQGSIADNIVSTLNDLGGLHTSEDFFKYEPVWEDPIKFDYNGFTIYEAPPNGQGIVVFFILELLKQFDVKNFSKSDYYHIYVEAVKIAYSLRDKFLGDPKYQKLDLMNLINENVIKNYANKINLDFANDIEISDFPEHKDTIYLTVKDKNGMIISFINSLFDQFGSGITVPQTGILLHCRGKSFSLKDNHPNQISGRKRPLHTIIPGMIGKNDDVIGSFGVMGGHYQAAGHAFILSQILDFHLSPQCALDLPRVFPNNGILDIEENFDLDLIAELKNKGHKINHPALPIGGGQIIINEIDNGISLGASDWRKDGIALGV